MIKSSIIEQLGFTKLINVQESKSLPDMQQSVIDDIAEFGVDDVYFCEDENNHSYPALFIKKVISFDSETLKQIVNIHRQIWNYKKVLFLYVYNDAEIRIYNCAERPLLQKEKKEHSEKDIRQIELISSKISDKDKLAELNNLFSAIAVDSGIIWTLEEAESLRKKIDLQKRVDKYLVDSLIRTAKQLQAEGLNISLIHKIIMRSLFLLYLEDRKATDALFYGQIKLDAQSYFDILDDVDATYLLYKKLENHFNGNVFSLEEEEIISKKQLQLIKNCFISGNDGTSQEVLFKDWRLFDFSIIQIELLSEIYENFLAEIEPDIKQQTGTYYTPPALVELILNEKLSVANKEKKYDIKILDPACGSGIFLVESFKRLVKRYENKHNIKLTDFEKLKELLTDNIFGIEIHPQSIKVAAFSLYLALVDKLNPKTIWQDKNNRLPNLINNPKDPTIKKQGNNLFCRDTVEINEEVESIQFDLVIGNPPFGTNNINISSSIREYCEEQNFAKEMVLPFLHKAIKFAPKGEIALIFNTKILTNTNSKYQNFRHWLFNDCHVEKIYNFSILRNAPKNFGGQLFGSATGPISIAFYRKEDIYGNSSKITYYAPKTFIKSNILEGVVIDNTDVKYLPREECKKADSKIWKIAMWGGAGDIALINRLTSNNIKTVDSFIGQYEIQSGVGFQLLTKKKDTPRPSENLATLKYLDADVIQRYFTNENVLCDVKKSIKTKKAIDFYLSHYNVSSIYDIESLSDFRRLGDEEAYKSPHIVVKKGLEDNRVCASVIEADCSFRDGVYGFYTDIKNKEALYTLMSYFNSKISSYYLFMTISSYGIEREQIMKNEYLSIPINLDQVDVKKINQLTGNILSSIQNRGFLECNEDIEDSEIESIISKSLDLTKEDHILINDAINISLDLFHKKEKSHALLPISNIEDYAFLFSEKLNAFLDSLELFANATIYTINRFSPLMMIKISFQNKKEKLYHSNEDLDSELSILEKRIWEEKSANIYFRKKLNYKVGEDIYIIRPNQKRFWTQTMAMEDASELILEILNED